MNLHPARPPRVALIGCAKQKAATTSAVRTMYRSLLFQAALRWALLHCDRVFILSALHGLLNLDDEIEPYDVTLPRDRAGRLAWGSRVGAQLVQAVGEIEAEVVVLAGERYEEAIHFDDPEWEYHWHTPLAGLEIGQRRAWLKNGAVRWLYRAGDGVLSTQVPTREAPRASRSSACDAGDLAEGCAGWGASGEVGSASPASSIPFAGAGSDSDGNVRR